MPLNGLPARWRRMKRKMNRRRRRWRGWARDSTVGALVGPVEEEEVPEERQAAEVVAGDSPSAVQDIPRAGIAAQDTDTRAEELAEK